MSELKTIAIALDPWKYKTFKRILKKNAYKYERTETNNPPLVILKIYTYDSEMLKSVIDKCLIECSKVKNKHPRGKHDVLH